MLSQHSDLDTLLATLGAEIPSNLSSDVTYQLSERVGEGGMSVAYVARRVCPSGTAPVVIKIMKPQFVRRFGETALLMVKKEAVALGRLNERVPPTPFVVRLIDVGTLAFRSGQHSIEIPWIAVEHVHGGAEGTTLAQRVAFSIQHTGSAFSPDRAAHALECLCKGLTAVHEVGVIHRDLKPENVLCCGFGQEEIFKVADFGVARPAGLVGTFGASSVGTPGFAPPELIVMDQAAIGPWSDVFSLAAVTYYALTGEAYFDVRSVTDAVIAMQDSRRRGLLDAPAICPEMRARPDACRAIDRALARATAALHFERPRDVEALAESILPWLRVDAPQLAPASRVRVPPPSDPSTDRVPSWTWMTRQTPCTDVVVRSVAWDSDGRCLAATGHGLAFWSGTSWLDAPTEGLPDPTTIRFVHRVSAGRWLVGAEDATFAIYTAAHGTRDVVRIADASVRVQLFSGTLGDLALVVGTNASAVPVLHALVGRRWLKPLALERASRISAATRLTDVTWLLAGRTHRADGFAAVYRPLDWSVQELAAPPVRAFVACAGQPDIGLGVVGGAEGVLLLVDSAGARVERVQPALDISSVAVDAAGGCWAGGQGRIWKRCVHVRTGQSWWECVWAEPTWTAPVVSMFADVGQVVGMAADGAIVEGRAGRPTCAIVPA